MPSYSKIFGGGERKRLAAAGAEEKSSNADAYIYQLLGDFPLSKLTLT